MGNKSQIEQMVSRELKGICTNCAHTNTCIYYKSATKMIIQCELYEFTGSAMNLEPPKGLCCTCDSSPNCKLVGRLFGVWTCNDYK